MEMRSVEILNVSILALFLASFNAYCGLKKRKLNKLKEQFFQQFFAEEKGSIETAKIFSIEELKKATNNFDEGKILGRGGYGIVYKGLLQDNTTVAIKKSKISDRSQIEQFINEVVILTQINHTNVVKLLGCCLETQVPLLVYEFIQGGTLDDHLHGQNQSLKLNWKTRLRIAAETAGALAYLHSATCPPIIHRDVKTTNILLDHNLKAKVSDFGASKIVPLDKTELSTMVQGTVGYLDPEYFHTSHLTEKSDVYSFGVVLAELLTGRKALCFELPEEDRNLAMYISSMNMNLLLHILDGAIIDEAKLEQLMEFGNIAKRCLE
ncbi:wall-associated receptor kinase 3-like [Arachis duranensis]|uniref:Wall-associated receptor kinase 3-like n=1 Tax=Arachis duranensis TaxID=130453 RepID=A0A9C6TES0_ARADU|nr:wall-associated receptor kinase 3-like [Arachis duranensis]